MGYRRKEMSKDGFLFYIAGEKTNLVSNDS